MDEQLGSRGGEVRDQYFELADLCFLAGLVLSGVDLQPGDAFIHLIVAHKEVEEQGHVLVGDEPPSELVLAVGAEGDGGTGQELILHMQQERPVQLQGRAVPLPLLHHQHHDLRLEQAVLCNLEGVGACLHDLLGYVELDGGLPLVGQGGLYCARQRVHRQVALARYA